MRDRLRSLRESWVTHPVSPALGQIIFHALHFRYSNASCDAIWELFSSRFPFSNKMATLGVNVSAFGIATYMIRDENLFFPGIL